jgi:hypothetical protein
MKTARFKGKGSKVVAFLFVVSLVAFSGSLMAKERAGAELEVMKTDGNSVRGELIALKQQSLLIKEWGTQADESIDIRNAKYIKIVGKSNILKGGLTGFLAGGVLGAVLGAVSPTGSASGKTRYVLVLTGGFAGIGGIIGTIVGGISHPGKKIQVEGKNDAEINAILKYLSSKARVPDAQ